MFVPLLITCFILALVLSSSQWWMTFAIISVFYINVALVYGPLGKLFAMDILEHMNVDAIDTIKENIRSGWTNTALMCALMVTVSLPMVQIPQVDITEDPTSLSVIGYRLCTLGATAFSMMGVIQPSLALVFTDTMSPHDTLKFVMCQPWTLGNPLGSALSSVMWTFFSLVMWAICDGTEHMIVFAGCIVLWLSWNLCASVRFIARWHPGVKVTDKQVIRTQGFQTVVAVRPSLAEANPLSA